MNRRTITLFFLIALAALPAAAYTHRTECWGHWTRWQVPNLTFYYSYLDLSGPEWGYSIAVAAETWNTAAGSKPRFSLSMFETLPGGGIFNNLNEIRIGDPASNWSWGSNVPAMTIHRSSNCSAVNPFDVAHYEEVDIILSPAANSWDKSPNPMPSDTLKNSTLVLQHELGHALGLGDEGGVLARMNTDWPGPMGGPLGSSNQVVPLADDVRGSRAAYGTGTAQRDVAGSAVRLASHGISRVIPAPGWTFRNASLSFPFTVHNLGTADETFPVYFYLSPTRSVNPNTSFYLGSTTISLLNGRSATGNVTVFIPPNAPSGAHYYLGWYIDPTSLIPEWSEANNGTSLVAGTYISDDRAPNACFTTTPNSGSTPLTVTFNASCSTDADGDALTYSWDFGDGTTGSGKVVSHEYYGAGLYRIRLTVTDPYGATAVATDGVTATCTSGQYCPEEPD